MDCSSKCALLNPAFMTSHDQQRNFFLIFIPWQYNNHLVRKKSLIFNKKEEKSDLAIFKLSLLKTRMEIWTWWNPEIKIHNWFLSSLLHLFNKAGKNTKLCHRLQKLLYSMCMVTIAMLLDMNCSYIKFYWRQMQPNSGEYWISMTTCFIQVTQETEFILIYLFCLVRRSTGS